MMFDVQSSTSLQSLLLIATPTMLSSPNLLGIQWIHPTAQQILPIILWAMDLTHLGDRTHVSNDMKCVASRGTKPVLIWFSRNL